MASVKKATLDKDGLAKASGLIIVYNFNPENGIYICASEEQLTQGVGIPANSTSIAPPDALPGKANLFSGDSWQQVDDHRGETVYNIQTGEVVEVSQLGDYPDGTTFLKPATEFDVWDGEQWVTDFNAQYAAALNGSKIMRSALLHDAKVQTQEWQIQLMLGIITEDDKKILIEWMKYIQTLQSLGEEELINGKWPVKPN